MEFQKRKMSVRIGGGGETDRGRLSKEERIDLSPKDKQH
jgi:hypothetical protein